MKKQQPEDTLLKSVLNHELSDRKGNTLTSENHEAAFQNIFESKTYSCPRCRSRHFVGVGKQKGVQRFQCKSCARYFSETTGMFMYCLKKRNLVKQYLECLLKGLSIRQSAKICGISKQTSFNWRHKILVALQSISSAEFERIVEVAGVEEPFSNKGQRKKKKEVRSETGEVNQQEETSKPNEAVKPKVPKTEDPKTVSILHARDWRGNQVMKVVCTAKMKKRDLERVLSDRLDKVQVLCSQANRSVTAFVKRKKVELVRSRKGGGGVRKAELGYQTNNVLRSVLEWRDFMEPFYGVATKYLQNYLNWFILTNLLKDSNNQIAQLLDILLKEERSWYQFKAGVFNTDFRT